MEVNGGLQYRECPQHGAILVSSGPAAPPCMALEHWRRSAPLWSSTCMEVNGGLQYRHCPRRGAVHEAARDQPVRRVAGALELEPRELRRGQAQPQCVWSGHGSVGKQPRSSRRWSGLDRCPGAGGLGGGRTVRPSPATVRVERPRVGRQAAPKLQSRPNSKCEMNESLWEPHRLPFISSSEKRQSVTDPCCLVNVGG